MTEDKELFWSLLWMLLAFVVLGLAVKYPWLWIR